MPDAGARQRQEPRAQPGARGPRCADRGGGRHGAGALGRDGLDTGAEPALSPCAGRGRKRWLRPREPIGTARRSKMVSLGGYAKEKGVKYFLVAFVDLFGTLLAKSVPATAIDTVAKSGAGFAGFAAWLDLTPAHPDVLVTPDPATLIQLPWKPEVAWVTGDLVMDGKPLVQNPRQVLKRIIDAAAAEGYEMKTGVECEYFLIQPDGSAISDAADTQAKPCYDQQALMRRYEVIKEICDAMIALGWNPYQNDHEDANGQFEMNWEYDT